jgi:hypothetical protein
VCDDFFENRREREREREKEKKGMTIATLCFAMLWEEGKKGVNGCERREKKRRKRSK